MVPHRKACAKLPTGLPPPMRPSKASVLHRRMHPRSGGVPLPMRGSDGVLLDGGVGAVLDGRGRSWEPGPLSTSCPAGPSQLVPYRLLLQSGFLSVAPQLTPPHRGKPRPLLPGRSQVSLIADAPHVFKSRGIRPSERLGDTSMPPEVMGRLDRGFAKNSAPRKKIFALRDCVQPPC